MIFSRRAAINITVMTGASVAGVAQTSPSGEATNLQDDVLAVNVRAFGALGDGTADDTAAIQAAVDHCFGEASRSHSGPNAHLNKPLYFPPGKYSTTAPIKLTNLRGAHIFGAGRFTTSIFNRAGNSVFKVDGFEYGRLEMMRLTSKGNSADVVELDWTNGGGTALQSNTFADLFIDGGAVGINIGKSGFMGSENLFLNCFFGPCAVAGMKISNFNALQNTIVGGNIQSCPLGVWVSSGCCSVYNTGFQGHSNTFDIRVDNSAHDTMMISGVRSESTNFAQLRNGITAHIVGCSHLSLTNGIFSDIDNSQVVIDSCVSRRGIVRGNSLVRISDSSFDRHDWIDEASIRNGYYELERCYIGGTRYRPQGAEFVPSKIITSFGVEWPAKRRAIPIKPGLGLARIPIAAGTRIQRVALVLDKPASAGIVHVGDQGDAGRYFAAANLTGQTVVSAVLEHKYQVPDILIAKWAGAADLIGHIAVDFVVES